jgi:gamma-glutamyltranspeptidase/glutathione hydrolase
VCRLLWAFLAAPLLLLPALTGAEDEPAKPRHGMVVAVSAPGAEVGRDVLRKGGNAVDAAVATALAMAVTYPAAGNIGGGGFMVIHPPGQEPVVVEYRETAPAAAHARMFKESDTWYNHRVVGVPGTVRGLFLAHARFGKLPWKDLVQPAIKLAEEGFALDAAVANQLNDAVYGADRASELRRVFGKDGGKEDWRPGDRLVQKDLGWSLRQIADNGPDAFYKGAIADKLLAEMKSGGGLITAADLAGYQAKVRKPIHGTFRGYDIYAPPPPSSGGITLVLMLNMLETHDLKKMGRWSPETLHLIIETMRRAYCERARHLGDGDFVKIPDYLTTKEYAKKLAAGIDPNKATPSASLAPDIPVRPEGDSTTHFSVIDGDGMAVSNTYTLERSFGSRIVVKGAGFLLNNEMIDFNWFPGVTTRSGEIGTPANQIAPGKRMLSSQTPTIVAKDGKVVLITGSPGSRTIINTSLQVVLNGLEFGMDPRAAVDAPRLHHQWFPDRVRFEGITEYTATVKKLEAMGHTFSATRQGDAHSIWVDPKTGTYIGAEDRRISGKVAGF